MICPNCGKDYPRLLALSRKDNLTQICDACGSLEAIEELKDTTGATETIKELIRYFCNEAEE